MEELGFLSCRPSVFMKLHFPHLFLAAFNKDILIPYDKANTVQSIPSKQHTPLAWREEWNLRFGTQPGHFTQEFVEPTNQTFTGFSSSLMRFYRRHPLTSQHGCKL